MKKDSSSQDQKQWQVGVNEPFKGDREKYAKIPKAQRSAFIKKLLLTQQLTIPQPQSFQKPFPIESKFKYLEYDLHYYAIENTPNPKAILLIIHGGNSSGSVFGYFADGIAKRNKDLNIYSFDQMNFGKSGGDLRGFASSFDDSIKQAEVFSEYIFSKFEKKPKIFLCGHSYGGSICFKMTLNTPQKYAGVIFLAPALRDISESHYYSKKLISFIGWLMPRKLIAQAPPPGLGSKYNLTQKFRNSPVIFTDGIMPGTLRTFFNAFGEISKLFGKFTSPFLCLAAGVEKLVDPFSALDFQEECKSQDKRVVYCGDMWHILYEEEGIRGVIWHCNQWLKPRM